MESGFCAFRIYLIDLPSELAAVAFLLYVKKVPFSAPFSPPSPPTQDPQYNNRTAVVKSIKVRVLYSSTFQKELV